MLTLSSSFFTQMWEICCMRVGKTIYRNFIACQISINSRNLTKKERKNRNVCWLLLTIEKCKAMIEKKFNVRK